MVGRKRAANKSGTQNERENGVEAKVAKIAELEEEISKKESTIVQNKDQLNSATATFKTVLALKNRKIKDLEKELEEKTTQHVDKINDLEREHAELASQQNKQIKDLKNLVIKLTTKKERLPDNIATPSMNGSNTVVIRTIFPNASKIETHTDYCSKKVSSAICQWTCILRKSDTHLGAFVKAEALDNSDRTFIHAHAKIRLLSHKNCSILHEHSFSSVHKFDMSGSRSRGNMSFIELKKLHDTNEKFVKGDEIIVEAIIKEIDLVA